jgi:hypothetical protein
MFCLALFPLPAVETTFEKYRRARIERGRLRALCSCRVLVYLAVARPFGFLALKTQCAEAGCWREKYIPVRTYFGAVRRWGTRWSWLDVWALERDNDISVQIKNRVRGHMTIS